MEVFENRVVKKLTFYQWINVEYGIVKRQYKELTRQEKCIINIKYQEYLKDTKW